MPQFAKNIEKSYKKYKKNSKIWSILFVFLIFLSSFLLIFNVSDIFSSIIMHKKSLFFLDRIDVTECIIYGVSARDFESEEDAMHYSESIIPTGAMGEVYHHGEYFVLTSTYPTLIEAQEVQGNLIRLGYEARIVNISIPLFRRDYRGEGKELIEEGLYKFRQIYSSLYNIDIQFDKGNLSRSSFSGQVAQVLTDFRNFMSFISASSISQKYKDALLSSYEAVTTLMEEVLYSTYSNFETSSLMKRNMLKIIEENIALLEKI